MSPLLVDTPTRTTTIVGVALVNVVTAQSIAGQSESTVAATGEGVHSVHADLSAASIVNKTLVHWTRAWPGGGSLTDGASEPHVTRTLSKVVALPISRADLAIASRPASLH